MVICTFGGFPVMTEFILNMAKEMKEYSLMKTNKLLIHHA